MTMTPSSLSMVDSRNPRAILQPGGGGTVRGPDGAANSSETSPQVSSALDFIGSSRVVKDLFSLPYAVDRTISVAVHNFGGTLLVDADLDQDETVAQTHFHNNSEKQRESTPAAKQESSLPENHERENQSSKEQEETLSRSLVSLSSLESNSEALTIVNSLIESNRSLILSPKNVRPAHSPHHELEGARLSVERKEIPVSTIGLPPPEEYVSHFIPPLPEPREYLSWKFHDMNLLVGSNAVIYRSPDASAALTVRVEEASDMKALAQQHHDLVRSGAFVADHQYAKLQQKGKPSYADAARRELQQIEQGKDQASKQAADSYTDPKKGTSKSFAAPDLEQVRLQTCIVPAPSAPVGGLLTARCVRGVVRLEPGVPEPVARSQSPVSTVLDTYLDNIMANVPQLALCLQEKGFVQSVKLLNTEHIPSSLLQPTTIDTSIPFEVVGGGKTAERVFSPEIMEMNAATLLRFLKTQCTKDNATYLLRREAGQTNIQLYDISSISSQQQQKWNWWLAKLSYRFASRLRSLASNTPDRVLRREFRARQRSLLKNTLELLGELSDMNGNSHESLVAAINEDLADTFLTNEEDEKSGSDESRGMKKPTFVATDLSYSSATVDSLTKAQDHFLQGIRMLWPTLKRIVGRSARSSRRRARNSSTRQVDVVSVQTEEESSGESGDDDGSGYGSESQDVGPVVSQLFGLHHKLVSVSLRLAEMHLGNYFSSSAMQALRTAARRLADSLYLVQLMKQANGEVSEEWMIQIQLQYTWLWEHCGHFARSFAADALWRERGHASGEDVISVLQDVDCALRGRGDLGIDLHSLSFIVNPRDHLSESSGGLISIHSLNGVVGSRTQGISKGENQILFSDSAIKAAEKVLSRQGLLKREQRRVLVAASIAYGRSIDSYSRTVLFSDKDGPNQTALLGLLQQRLGDACNETGKVIMNEVRRLLPTLPPEASEDQEPLMAAEPLLCASEFWFIEGLAVFDACKDLRNIALLRCNLCQCWKLRANSVFPREESKLVDGATHAETCLQEAANHLQAAHEALGQRDADAMTWDMVSAELAATFLVLGVRRRQSLIGSGNTPVILHALRLNPGKERSIVDPMDRALVIYEQMGNHHQAAAAHYQLALFYSKIWTCQRDEVKTREKLAAAFQHYIAAHAFFSQNVRGNEPTFCVLCLDLSNLYSSVSGEEFSAKALLRCLDTSTAFSRETVDEVSRDLSKRSEWLQKMDTLAVSVEDRVFKILRNLVKLEETSGKKDYKELYRVGLHAKMAPALMTPPTALGDESLDAIVKRLLAMHGILQALQQKLNKSDRPKT